MYRQDEAYFGEKASGPKMVHAVLVSNGSESCNHGGDI